MGDLTIKKWQCDCCRKIYDKRPQVKRPRITIVVEVEEEWHACVRKMKEMCPECNAALMNIEKIIDGIVVDRRKHVDG